MKKIFYIFCVLVPLCLLLASCGEKPPEAIESRTLTLSENNIILEVGERLTLTVSTSPASWGNPEIFWYSSNPEIAECVGGVITARAVGTCLVKAYTEDGISAPTTVIVREGLDSLATVNMNDVGKTVNYTDKESGEILSSAEITGYSVSLERTQSTFVSLTLRATVDIYGVKTFDALGDEGTTPIAFRAQALRTSDNALFDSPILGVKDVKVGESFSLSYSFTFYSDGRTRTAYHVSLADSDTWLDCDSLLNFEVKNIGKELSDTDKTSGALLGKAIINSYDVEYYYYPDEPETPEYMYVTVILKGRKTYDPKGEDGEGDFRFNVKLYSENDAFKQSTDLICAEVKNGAEFKATYTFKAATQDKNVRSFYITLGEIGK